MNAKQRYRAHPFGSPTWDAWWAISDTTKDHTPEPMVVANHMTEQLAKRIAALLNEDEERRKNER